MARHTLYAYATGSDFDDIAEQVVECVNEFIAGRRWVCLDVWAVNQHPAPDEWELGLNLSLPDTQQEPPGWYADVEAVVAFCCRLRRDFHQDFAIGIADDRTGCAEDIIEVVSDHPDYDYLSRFIESAPSTLDS